jgi:hypothetical protein
LLYKPKYIPLHEAVRLISDRLAAANRSKYADANVAIGEAREQLLEALFEGGVRAEGVRAHPTDPPADNGPLYIQYDKWSLINRGVWIHKKYEKKNDIFHLNTISVHWDEDFIEYYDSDGEWAECIDWKIRLFCTDIDREFPALEVPLSAPVEQDYKTGLPGRPSPRHLASAEMHRRAKEGTLCAGIGAEMRELWRWLKQEHPNAPPTTPKSLETALRQEYRSLKGAKKASSVDRRSRDTAV